MDIPSSASSPIQRPQLRKSILAASATALFAIQTLLAPSAEAAPIAMVASLQPETRTIPAPHEAGEHNNSMFTPEHRQEIYGDNNIPVLPMDTWNFFERLYTQHPSYDDAQVKIGGRLVEQQQRSELHWYCKMLVLAHIKLRDFGLYVLEYLGYIRTYGNTVIFLKEHINDVANPLNQIGSFMGGRSETARLEKILQLITLTVQERHQLPPKMNDAEVDMTLRSLADRITAIHVHGVAEDLQKIIDTTLRSLPEDPKKEESQYTG